MLVSITGPAAAGQVSGALFGGGSLGRCSSRGGRLTVDSFLQANASALASLEVLALQGDGEPLVTPADIPKRSIRHERRRDVAGRGLRRKPGRKPKQDAKDRRIAELEKRSARLEEKLALAEKLIDLQKKVSAILGINLTTDGER